MVESEDPVERGSLLLPGLLGREYPIVKDISSTKEEENIVNSRIVAPASSQTTSPNPAMLAKSIGTDYEEEELTALRSLHVRRDWYSSLATFAAGGVAGAASRTLTAPLDRIKLIVQEGHLVPTPPQRSPPIQTAPAGLSTSSATGTTRVDRRHPSLMEVARMIKKDGGWKAFWRGNVINCFKAGPEFAIVFSIRRYLSSLYEDCVEREKTRRKVIVARWKEEEALSAAISRREQKERESMLSSCEVTRLVRTSVSQERGSRVAVAETSPYAPSLTALSTPRAHASSIPPPETAASLTVQEQRERERVIARETSIFTPPFNRLGCISSFPPLMVHCTIGAVAGLGAQGFLYPLEVVKTRVVVSTSHEYRGGFMEVIRLGYRRGGFMDFYRGFVPNMVGIVVYRGLEMGLYSSAQQSIMLYRMQVKKMSRHDASLNAAEVGVVGMFASTVAQTVSYPLNVIRTRLQTQGTNGRAKKYTGMADCMIKMIRHKGVTSLFSGLTANYLKAVPASACTFVVFEWAQRLLVGDD